MFFINLDFIYLKNDARGNAFYREVVVLLPETTLHTHVALPKHKPGRYAAMVRFHGSTGIPPPPPATSSTV